MKFKFLIIFFGFCEIARTVELSEYNTSDLAIKSSLSNEKDEFIKSLVGGIHIRINNMEHDDQDKVLGKTTADMDEMTKVVQDLKKRMEDQEKALQMFLNESTQKANNNTTTEQLSECYCIEPLQKQNDNITEELQTINERLVAQGELIQKIFDSIDSLKLSKISILQPTQNDWIVIQRRQDGSVDFNRNWDDYKTGFGDPSGEFFIGLEKLHEMTELGEPQELRIVMKDFDNQTRYANYDRFIIGNESEKYKLKVLGSYSGDAGDSLKYHAGQNFSTKDNDNVGKGVNCGESRKGGWWYDYCAESTLNGPYFNTPYNSGEWGIHWYSWLGKTYSLKFVQIMIRQIS